MQDFNNKISQTIVTPLLFSNVDHKLKLKATSTAALIVVKPDTVCATVRRGDHTCRLIEHRDRVRQLHAIFILRTDPIISSNAPK